MRRDEAIAEACRHKPDWHLRRHTSVVVLLSTNTNHKEEAQRSQFKLKLKTKSQKGNRRFRISTVAPQQWREPREALVKHHKRISQRRWRLSRRREEKGRGMRHELHDSALFLIRNKSRRQISRGTPETSGRRAH